MKRRHAAIALTTDFGTADPYVGAMKGVLATLAPGVPILDATHELAPFDRLGAALYLRAIAPHYPAGTVHLAVVDPGVGGARDPIVVRALGQNFVGPDNGIFTFLLAGRFEAWTILPSRLPRRAIHPTFHGRDLFAPAAALLATGVEPAKIGRRKARPFVLQIPAVREVRTARARTLHGTVLHVDRFGNLMTSIPEDRLAAPGRTAIEVRVGRGSVRGLARTYSDVGHGRLVALPGSSGFLEVAVREGSAARRLAARAGTPVVVSIPDGHSDIPRRARSGGGR